MDTKKLIIIFFLMFIAAMVLFAEGPIFRHKDAIVQQEFENSYQDIRKVTKNIFSGTGSPNNVITAPVGSLFLRTDGGASTTLYVKESGTGSAGWVAK